jgi:FMN phosphatase YigB (HAD superfamily)
VTATPRSVGRWVCLDVGETLIEETRIWDTWADALGVPRMTFLAAYGAAVARGGDHHGVFELMGVPDWQSRAPEIRRRQGPLRAGDLYPDALSGIAGLRARGYRVSVIGNQPAERGAELRALGVDAEVMAMSEEMGLSKPDPAFFRRSLELMGDPDPSMVAYVGDRPDNDVRPAAAAGMRAVWLRRGPWGVISGEAPGAVLVVRSLTELVDRIDAAWPDEPAATPGSRAPLA